VNQGHTLAHHTHSHNRLTNHSSENVSSLIDKGVSSLQKIAYSDSSSTPRTPFFRYPYLAKNKRTDGVVAKKGMIAFGANIDSLDWKKSSPKKLHDRIMKRLRKQGRGIILMHDIQARTAKMLPDLLRSLKSEGYKVVHIVSKTNNRPATKPLVVASLAKSVKQERSGVVPQRVAKEKSSARAKKVRKRVYYSTRASSSNRKKSQGKRHSKLVLLAGAKTRGTIAIGNLKLRRSQWILR